MADFASGLHLLVQGVLGHFLHKLQRHLVDHTVVEGQVEPVLLGHLAAGPGALVGGLLGHLREQLVLEVDLGQVFEVLGHPAGLHSADFAVEGLVRGVPGY